MHSCFSLGLSFALSAQLFLLGSFICPSAQLFLLGSLICSSAQLLLLGSLICSSAQLILLGSLICSSAQLILLGSLICSSAQLILLGSLVLSCFSLGLSFALVHSCFSLAQIGSPICTSAKLTCMEVWGRPSWYLIDLDLREYSLTSFTTPQANETGMTPVFICEQFCRYSRLSLYIWDPATHGDYYPVRMHAAGVK